MNKIAITMGDPAGIGPEIILKSLAELDCSNLLLIGNRDIFTRIEKICGLSLHQNINFCNVGYDVSNIILGTENLHSGELAYLCLSKACELINSGEVSCVATAPVSKNALHMAGYNYSGQTEILQEKLADASNCEKAEMLFVAGNLKVLLLTRHLALKDVIEQVNSENIINTVKVFNNELIEKFKIKKPRIAMCALNPHAGENGILGSEEKEIINPTIELLQNQGVCIQGAFSADTLLSKAVKNFETPEFDAYIACYHDQGLCAIKSLGLDKVLNITIGLKALRSSPSHGTAFDIAYQNKADYKSMLNSISFLQNLM